MGQSSHIHMQTLIYKHACHVFHLIVHDEAGVLVEDWIGRALAERHKWLQQMDGIQIGRRGLHHSVCL